MNAATKRTRVQYAGSRAKSSVQPGRRTTVQSSNIRIGRFALIVALAAVMIGSGCASYTLDESECRAGAWADIGYTDGAAGSSAERIKEHQKACDRFKIALDKAAYNQGREKGLSQYCSRANGLEIGRRGADYKGVCPEHLKDVFLKAFNHGREIREVEQNIKKVDRNIEKADWAIAEAKAWTLEAELAKQLAAVDQNISRKRMRILEDIQTKARQLSEMPNTGKDNQRIALQEAIARLEADESRLDVQRIKDRTDVKLKHERSKAGLIARNKSKLADNIERKAGQEKRKVELKAKLSELLEAVANDTY